MNKQKKQDQHQIGMAQQQQQNTGQPRAAKNDQGKPVHEHERPELRMTD